MNYYEKHENLIAESIEALKTRNYFTVYPEIPKLYGEEGDSMARAFISSAMNNDFNELLQENSKGYVGEEISPYLQVGIGIKYPTCENEVYINNAKLSIKEWENVDVKTRAGILIESLEGIKRRFFDIAYATMHTTGQSYMMSFQASGPHSNDRALEAIIMGYLELTKHVTEVDWIKPMGKFNLKIHKTWRAVPKGISLVIGCSTFPIWNTVPGLYASLITGNPVIVKPHPKAILPIAIVVAEIQKTLKQAGINPLLVQLATDTPDQPITKALAESKEVKLIDYTGGSEFGNYVESLGKTVFTEKAGVNSIILDSVSDLNPVMQNIAFSASLYTGQMCTAPQNIFISKDGIKAGEGTMSFDDVVKTLCDSITGLVDNPKAGAPTLGAVQSEQTYNRVQQVDQFGGKVLLASKAIKNEEFPDARIATPTVVELSRDQVSVYSNECFGPILFVIKTDSVEDSIELAKNLAEAKGAITCGAYTTDKLIEEKIATEMNAVFTPVSFNFTGAAFINSHAAFSDYHVTGGNLAGNASFTNTEFVAKRFVWVGNRYA